MTNLSRSFCSRPRKSKIQLERKLFLRESDIFFENSAFFGFWRCSSAKYFGFFEDCCRFLSQHPRYPKDQLLADRKT